MTTKERTIDRLRRGARRLLGNILALCLSLAVLEVGFGTYFFFRNGRRYVSASELLAQEQNTFIREAKAHEGCSYLDTLFPHPYLAFVHHGNPPCGLAVNNIGLFGADFPSEKNREVFTILLTGGSVAAQVAGLPRIPGLNHGLQNQLEIALNDRYESPQGKKFLVLNGGDGAWKQPQQTILFLLYADAVDALVTLDGFNEHGSVTGTKRFEAPASNFPAVNPYLDTGARRMVGVWLQTGVHAYAQSHWLTSHSYTAYGLTRTLRESIRAWSEREPERSTRTTVDSIFALPAGLDAATKRRFNLEQYRKYLRVMDAVATRSGLPSAHFIQPAPALGKKLTEQERMVVGGLEYGESYAAMTRSLLALNEEGLPVFSLLDLFKDVEGTVYADPIHCASDPETGESPGYKRMAERMTELIGTRWHLKRKAAPR
jgi:hypothetical protein